jgi:iduronate 2-sulfatase
VVQQTIEWLEARANDRKPFFIGNGFRRPHAPYAAPKKYYDLYRVEDIPLPNTSPKDFRKALPAAVNFDPPDKPLTDLEVRQQIRAYYACVSFVDAQLGLLLDAMDRLKLWNNTIVVLSVDHGYLLGEHGGMWHKMSLFEEATHIPMIVATPGMHNAGRHSKGFVESVDLYPTIVELCGLKGPGNLEGLSFAPLLAKPDRPWKQGAFSTQGRGQERGESANDIQFLGHSVRTERWRYTEWDGGKQGIELYDKVADPGEVNNLAGDPRAAREQAKLQSLLHSGWKAALPQPG